MSILGGLRQSWIGDDEILDGPSHDVNSKDPESPAVSATNRIRETLINEDIKAQWCVPALAHTLAACLISNLNFTMHIAFFPKAAMEKGLSTIGIGSIFSIYQVAYLLTTFFVPKMTRRMDSWSLLRFSIAPHAVVTGLLALALKIPGSYGFMAFALVLRAIEGSLAAVIDTTATEITKNSVPDEHLESTVVWIEIAKTIGVLAGPITGGGLRKVGGFGLPMVFVSALFSALFLLMLVPFVGRGGPMPEEINKSSIFTMMKVPILWIMALGIFSSCAAISFLEPTLQPLVSRFPYYYDEVQMGLLYLILVTAYAVSASITDRITQYLGMLIPLSVGLVSTTIGFFVISSPQHHPLITLDIDVEKNSNHQDIGYIIGGLICMGIGSGLSLITASMIIMEETAFNDISREEVYSIVPWVGSIVYAIGNSTGPFLGGILDHSVGFSKATQIIGIIQSIVSAIVITSYAVFLYRTVRERQETTEPESHNSPLLQSHYDDQPQVTIK